MNILHIDTESTWRGGEQQVGWLVEGLQSRGVGRQLIAAQPGGALAMRAKGQGWDVVEIPMRGGWDWRAARRIADLVRRSRIDLVHAHTSHAHSLAWLGVARPGVAPVVVTRRVDFPIGGGWFGSIRRAKYVHPRVHLIAISTGVREVLVSGGVPRERITVVPSGIDLARLQGPHSREKLRALVEADPQTPLIGNVAALTDHKGQIYLIRAAAMVREWIQQERNAQAGTEPKDFRVVIVGEGEERPRLEAEIEKWQLGRQVRLLGWRTDVPDCLAAFDVFCLSSHLEGLGTSLLDAMGMGLPVVATRAGGIPDAVTDCETGLLVPPRDVKALAKALIRCLEDPSLRRHLGEAGRRSVAERFTVDRMVEGTLAVYRGVPGLA